jgi:hypothetical protein
VADAWPGSWSDGRRTAAAPLIPEISIVTPFTCSRSATDNVVQM